MTERSEFEIRGNGGAVAIPKLGMAKWWVSGGRGRNLRDVIAET